MQALVHGQYAEEGRSGCQMLKQSSMSQVRCRTQADKRSDAPLRQAGRRQTKVHMSSAYSQTLG